MAAFIGMDQQGWAGVWGKGGRKPGLRVRDLRCQYHLMCREGIRISVMQDGGEGH